MLGPRFTDQALHYIDPEHFVALRLFLFLLPILLVDFMYPWRWLILLLVVKFTVYMTSSLRAFTNDTP